MNTTPDRHFSDEDLADLWDDHPYSLESYVEPAPDDDLVASVQAELGYRLPAAYVELAGMHNGGLLARDCFPTEDENHEGYFSITGIYAIGRTARYSLCGQFGSPFMQQEWGYPDIGIVIADTPSAGHDMIMLDYRDCGPQGEPRVVHVDQEGDYAITFVAPDFASFVRGLVSSDEYDTSEQDKQAALEMAAQASLSPIVVAALGRAGSRLPDGERRLRDLATRIIEEKGFFSLHADPLSHRMYGLMFWLYSQLTTAVSFEAFIAPPKGQAAYDPPTYEMMIVFGLVSDPYGLNTGGYAQGFVQDWWETRVAAGDIVHGAGGYRYSEAAERALLAGLTT